MRGVSLGPTPYLIRTDPLPVLGCTVSRFPSPPAEQTGAHQNCARQSDTDDWSGNRNRGEVGQAAGSDGQGGTRSSRTRSGLEASVGPKKSDLSKSATVSSKGVDRNQIALSIDLPFQQVEVGAAIAETANTGNCKDV